MLENPLSTTPVVPQCVGFIMDGNRRWAKEQNFATLDGHKAGESIFYDSAQWVKELCIPHAVYYAFSTENWQRNPAEVSYLMQLFELFLERMLGEITEVQVRVKVVGARADFSVHLQSLIERLETVSEQYTKTTIWVALSYGGRADIVSACNQAIEAGVPVNEESFGRYLQTNGMPDPDLIIRTSGEQRLSNFLPWQSVYSELFFTDTYWPAFTKEEFTRIVGQYGDRQRRRGK
ncbi:di-trans,poly-cis-decaprenylcistransferase [Patescibacteria group bacterium]|nr:di-trans,poly-cis-decaprenylcistransferase [Patescibacteria group bacterium]